MSDFESQICFAVNQAARGEYLQRNGRTFLVAPMVSLREGVLNNELVLADEFSKHVAAWNGRPFVIGHPRDVDGKHVSANSPDILEGAIGQIFDTTFDGKLSHQVWIDKVKAQASTEGAEVLRRLESGEPLDVSTAYWRDIDPTPGTFNGKEYVGIARNLRPDHVAALLYENGACSWRDGCGAPRVNSEEEGMPDDFVVNPFPNEHAARIASPGQFQKFRRSNDELGAGIHAIFGIKSEGGKQISEIQAVRFDKDKFTSAEARAWLREHDFKAIEFEEASGGEVRSNEDSTMEWVKSTLAKVADALNINLQSKSDGGVKPMNETIARITEAVGLEDGSAFAEMPEDVLTALANALTPVQEVQEQQPEEDAQEPQANEQTPCEQAAQKREQKPNELPDGIVALAEAIEKRGGLDHVLGLIDGLQANEDSRKAQLVERLSANATCAFSKDDLRKMDVGTLGLLHRSLMPADYSGQGMELLQANEGNVEVAMPKWYEQQEVQ